MKLIIKSAEPEEWRNYRKTEGAIYEAKQCLRESLYKEQGGICAYCMQRLDDETEESLVGSNRIEHIKCRDKYPESQLDYQNMVLCCNGRSNEHKHCDLSKENQEISFTPLDPLFITTLSYGSKNGEIKSSHTDWDNEMNHILNLNKNILRKNRHSALKGVITQLKKGWKVSQVRKELEKWRNKESNGHYKPYCGIVISYLEKKIKRYE